MKVYLKVVCLSVLMSLASLSIAATSSLENTGKQTTVQSGSDKAEGSMVLAAEKHSNESSDS